MKKHFLFLGAFLLSALAATAQTRQADGAVEALPGDAQVSSTNLTNEADAGDNVASVPMIVQLTGFNVGAVSCRVQFQWTAINEIGLERYDVQYSTDGIKFHTIGTVPAGAESKSYRFSWDATVEGNTLFRLRPMNGDGTEEFSAVVALRLNCNTGSPLTVAPNPVGGTLYVRGLSDGMHTLTLLNGSGTPVKFISAHTSVATIDLSDLEAGHYFLRVEKEGRLIMMEKLTKR